MTDPVRSEEQQRLGTSEQLDRVLQVTTPKAWLALCTLIVMLTAVVVWAILSEVSTYVRAEGIILSRGGMVVGAVSPAAGRLARIVPGEGDLVVEGDLVAEIFDAETMERYLGAVALADEHARALRDREAEATEENALAERHLLRHRARLDELERPLRQRVEMLGERLRDNRELLARGLITRAVVERDEEDLDLARRNLFDVLRRRDDLGAGEIRRSNDLKARIAEAKTQRLAADRRVTELAALIETWRILAPVTGRVTEIRAQAGATLEPGQPVLGIETGEEREGLDVLFYVPPMEGKRVEAGLPALVSPATVRREEFGSMTGTVENISEFPVSLDGMIAVLQSRDLARAFSESGPPYAGRIALTRDASTASGFAWTSPQATVVNVRPGTIAMVEVEVASDPPIALVVPWLKEALGL